MLLFIVVAGALYVLYTKPEFVPGHRAPGLERPVSYTAIPGKPTPTPDARPHAPATPPAPAAASPAAPAPPAEPAAASTAGTAPASTEPPPASIAEPAAA